MVDNSRLRLSDSEILERSVLEPVLFAAIVSQWSESLLGYFYRRVFDADTALDLTAETLAVAFERRHRYKRTDAPASAWLFGIARRELGRYRRRGRVAARAVTRLGIQVPRIDECSAERIAELADAAAMREPLRNALASLSDPERQAIRLRVLEDRGYDEVAAEMGCSEGAARVRVHRGLRRLAKHLEACS